MGGRELKINSFHCCLFNKVATEAVICVTISLTMLLPSYSILNNPN